MPITACSPCPPSASGDDDLDVGDSGASLDELKSSGEELYQYSIVLEASPPPSPPSEAEWPDDDAAPRVDADPKVTADVVSEGEPE